MSSHPSCPGVEKYPNFGSEKMAHVTRALPLRACLVEADALFPMCACMTPGHLAEHPGGIK